MNVMSAASSYGLRGAEPCRDLLLSGTKRVDSGARRRSARFVVLRFLLREEDREVDWVSVQSAIFHDTWNFRATPTIVIICRIRGVGKVETGSDVENRTRGPSKARQDDSPQIPYPRTEGAPHFL